MNRFSSLFLRWFFVFALAAGLSFSAHAVSISSSTHPTLVTRDFSKDVGFAAYQRTGGVESGARFEIDNGALKITNEYAGSFGVDTKVPAFDAEKYGHLFFDYRIPPAPNQSQTVKVNIFARVKGLPRRALYRAGRSASGQRLFGRIERCCGRWKMASGLFSPSAIGCVNCIPAKRSCRSRKSSSATGTTLII